MAGVGFFRQFLQNFTFLSQTTNDVSETSSSGNPSNQIIRHQYEINDDMLLKDVEGLLFVTTGAATAGSGISAELALTYIRPDGTTDPTPFYDQTITQATPATAFKFHFPPVSLQKLLAKGGKINAVLTVIGNYGAPSTTSVSSRIHASGECSFVKFSLSPLHTSKETERTLERLST